MTESKECKVKLGRVGAVVAAVSLSMTLAACGSRLAPEQVATLNNQSYGGGSTATDGGGVTDPNASGTTGGTAGGTTGGTTGGSAGGTTGGTTGGSNGGANGVKGPQPVKAVDCTGFKNQTGITNSTITIANSSDISGPVPGIFEAAQDATKAFVAYFNATSNICGRKLKLLALDSQADASADQQAYAKACEQAFAAVGSMSAYDSGGAQTAQNCGLPDIRAAAVTTERNQCTTCFGAQSVNSKEFENAVPDFFLKNDHAASQKAAFLYINIGAAAENGKNQPAAMEKRGMHFVYQSGIDVSEFNYAPYVQKMKAAGVRWVQFLGAYQQAAKLAQTMKQQGFKPDAFVLDPTAYTPDYIKLANGDAEGTYIFVNFTPFEEAASNPELQLYESWLQQVHPGAQPTFFGLFAWSAARLFADQAAALGGRLTRASLVASMKKVDNWTDNGLHAPQHVGAKNIGDCWRFLQVKGGKFTPVGGTKYICHGYTSLG